MENRFLALLVLLFALFWATCAAAEGQVWTGAPVIIERLEIQVNTNPGDRFDWGGLAKDIIALYKGDILTKERLKKAQKDLEPLARVQTSIHILPKGAILTFSIQPYQRIKSIDIHGAYPLFESDIRNLITVTPGDIFLPRMVAEQIQLIKQGYLAEGYVDPQVAIQSEEDRNDGSIKLSIRINKGDAYTVGRFVLDGNEAFSHTFLKGRMATWRQGLLQLGMGRLTLADLKEDVQNLTTFYRKKGFADVGIGHKVQRDPRQKKVHIHVTIDEGARYTIHFSGNRFFDDDNLRDDLVIFEIGNQGNIGLRRSVQNIRRRYLKAGFADVRLRWKAAAQADPPIERQITIHIEEGARYIVSQVNIEGNKALSSEAIQGQMLTRPPQGLSPGTYAVMVLQEDEAAVSALYSQNGYLHMQLVKDVAIDPEKQSVEVTLSIEEGPQTRVDQIRIEGLPSTDADRLSAELPYSVGSIYHPRMIQTGENVLAGQLAAKGYPHVRVQGRVELSDDLTRASIVYRIDTGPFVRLGHLYWIGNFRTRDHLVAREVRLKEGTPFSLKQVLAAQRRLRDLGLFQSVQVRTIGLKEKSGQVHLLVSVVEKRPYFLELGAGYQTDKGLYGRTKVGDRNFLGLNKELRVGGEVSEVGYRWETGIVEPRLLGSPISADLNVFTERKEEFNQDFGTDTYGGRLTFSRPLGDRLAVSLGISYEERQQFLRETDAASTDVDPAELESRSIWVTTPSIRFDSRDSFIRPRKGSLASLSANVSRGLEDSLDNFIKYKLDMRTYLTPKPRLTLAGRALVGYIQSYADDEAIPEDQLFFLGGTTDVRGFEENLLRFDSDDDPEGGRREMAASVEARYQLNAKWELTLFVDGGAIQDTLSGDDSNDDWRWAYGTGLRYLTPIGPIGLLYGRKADPRPGESDGAFHFSMGYTF